MRDLPTEGRRFRLLAAPLALFACAGCGGGNDAMKKHVKELETQVTKLRADADRLEERLEAVELNTAVAARASAKRRDHSEERPRLKVIRLSPDAEETAGAPADDPPAAPAAKPAEDEGKRPVIRGKGDNVIKTGASVQWRRGGIAGKSGGVTEDPRAGKRAPRLSPPFPGMTGTRRVSSEG